MKLKPLPFPNSYNEIGARREPQSSRSQWHPRVRVCERASIRQRAPATAHWQPRPCDFKAAHAGATRSTGELPAPATEGADGLQIPKGPGAVLPFPDRDCFSRNPGPQAGATGMPASGHWHHDASAGPRLAPEPAWHGVARSTWPQWTRLGLAQQKLRSAQARRRRRPATRCAGPGPGRGPGPSRDRDPRGAGHVASQQSRASEVRVRAALSGAGSGTDSGLRSGTGPTTVLSTSSTS
jgi:hypothetical protein